MANPDKIDSYNSRVTATARAGGYVDGFARDSKTKGLVATTLGAQKGLNRMTSRQKKIILENVNSGILRSMTSNNMGLLMYQNYPY